MKLFSLFLVGFLTPGFLLFFWQTADAQKSREDRIREVRRIVYEHQFSYHGYQADYETYNWEEEQVIPGLSEEEKEREYNEFGNYTAEKWSYYNDSGELILILIDDSYQYYQENRIVSRERYYFFSEGSLICFQESILEEHYYSDDVKTCSKEILLYNDEIIYFDTATLSDDAEPKVEEKAISNLTSDDKKALRAYEYLYPDW